MGQLLQLASARATALSPTPIASLITSTWPSQSGPLPMPMVTIRCAFRVISAVAAVQPPAARPLATEALLGDVGRERFEDLVGGGDVGVRLKQRFLQLLVEVFVDHASTDHSVDLLHQSLKHSL